MQIDPFLSLCTKLKTKWIKVLYIKPDSLKLLEEKVGKKLKHMGTNKDHENFKQLDGTRNIILREVI